MKDGLPHEESATAPEEGQEQELSQEQGQKSGQADTEHNSSQKSEQGAKHVPYERLEKVSKQNQELRRQLQEFQERLETMGKPPDVLQQEAKKKELERKFYQDPHEYVEQTKAELFDEFKKVQSEIQDKSEFNGMIKELRSSPGFSQELEDAMVAKIQARGLKSLGRVNALISAYESVTGKEWGSWNADSYNTRLTKQRLMRPSSSGSSGDNRAIGPDQFKNLSLDEYEKNPRKYNEAYAAYMQQNQ